MTDTEMLEKILKEQQKQTHLIAQIGLFVTRLWWLGLVLVIIGVIQLFV